MRNLKGFSEEKKIDYFGKSRSSLASMGTVFVIIATAQSPKGAKKPNKTLLFAA